MDIKRKVADFAQADSSAVLAWYYADMAVMFVVANEWKGQVFSAVYDGLNRWHEDIDADHEDSYDMCPGDYVCEEMDKLHIPYYVYSEFCSSELADEWDFFLLEVEKVLPCNWVNSWWDAP